MIFLSVLISLRDLHGTNVTKKLLSNIQLFSIFNSLNPGLNEFEIEASSLLLRA